MSDDNSHAIELAEPIERKPRNRRAGDGPQLAGGYDSAQCVDDKGAAVLLGVHISTLYEIQKSDPDFPEPVYLLPGNRVKRWPVLVLRRYIAGKIQEAARR